MQFQLMIVAVALLITGCNSTPDRPLVNKGIIKNATMHEVLDVNVKHYPTGAVASFSSILPYRDAERTKITLKTKSAYVVAFGVPGISSEDLRYSLEKVSDIIETNALGKRCSISFS